MAPSFIRLGAAAAVLLGFSGNYPESGVGPFGGYSPKIINPVTFASANDEKDDDGVDPENEAKLEGSSSDSEDTSSSLVPSKGLRGSRKKASKKKAKEEGGVSLQDMKSFQDHLGSILGPELARSLGLGDDDDALSAQLDDLMNRVFVARLQVPPKFKGSLELVNEAIDRTILQNSKSGKYSPQVLQQAYGRLINPPPALEVPRSFVDIRAAADKYHWDKERKLLIRRLEKAGMPAPQRLLQTYDEAVKDFLEGEKTMEEDLLHDEILRRLMLINSWIRLQYRLRLYYMKRQGTLRENPADLLKDFDAGPNNIEVSNDEVDGLSYGAELEELLIDSDELGSEDEVAGAPLGSEEKVTPE